MGNNESGSKKMTAEFFTERQIRILRYLAGNTSPSNKLLFDNVIRGTLCEMDVGKVCELINDEFLTKGIEPDFSATAYGQELEALLDLVNIRRIS
jgi:hypothetical protein